MSRAKRSVTARARHKKIIAQAKGYRGRRKNVFRVAKQAVTRAGQYAYRDRRQKKRQFRSLWISRINAAAREHGLSYSRFINGLGRAAVAIDRKILAELAVHDKPAFAQLAEKARSELAVPGTAAAQAEPATEQTEPVAGQAEPFAGQAEPVAGQAQPFAGQAEPGTTPS